MYTRRLLVLIAISVVAATVLDHYFWPDRNVPTLYVVPVLLASFAESSLLVVVVSAAVIVLDLISILESKPPLGLWPFTLLALLSACYLALRVAGQRVIIRHQVEEAERARWNELLLSDVAHELRTPLTVILGYTQLLRSNPNIPAPLHGPLMVIEASANRMRVAIDDLAQRWKPGERE
jgi:signal transduction histidine kinase